MEIWKHIPNFSRYQVSTRGRLRSTNYKNSGETKVLKAAISDRGYLKTMLQNDNGDYKTSAVHRWVALTFLGKKQKGLEINHIDGDKLNNAPDNLEYCTRIENMRHAASNGLRPRGEKHPSSILTKKNVIDIRKIYSNGLQNCRELSIEYGLSESHVNKIINRKKWKHV